MSNATPAGKGAARGYTWPPFQPGNTKAVRHGLDALVRPERHQRVLPEVQARIEAHFEELRARFPHLDEADAQQFRLFAEADAKAQLLGEWIDAVIFGEQEAFHYNANAPRTGVQAVPDHIYRAHRAYMSQARELARDLGMNSAGRSALARDLYTAAKNARAEGVADLIRAGLRDLDAEDRR